MPPKLVAIRDTSQSNICRTCLQEGTVKSIYDDCANGICILEKLISCTLVQFTENDGLPSNICSTCLKQIDEAYLFSQKCEEVDKILRKYYEKPLIPKAKRNRLCCGENTEEVPVPETPSVPESNNTITNVETINAPVNGVNFIIITSNSEDNIYKQIATESKEIEPIDNKEIPAVVQEETEPIVARYTCKRCDVHFPLYHLLKEHYRKPEHINHTTKVCEICKKVVRYRHYYKHLSNHNKSNQYCCEFCGRYFSNDSNLLRHRNIHLGIKPYLCDICGRKFTQSSAMKAHRRIHTGEKPYICPICGKTFYSNTTLNGHVQSHNRRDGDPNSERRQRVNKDIPIEEWLDKEIVSREQNASKQETDKIECEICKQKFRTPAGLKTHLVVHEEKKFNCTSCSRKFGTLGRLETHMKVHSAERPFSCHICGKTFITKMCLKNHAFLHTGRKPYTCEYCDKNFVHLGQLRSHALIHTGNKPHVCKFCGKAFALNGNLTVHMRKHTGEFPFVCSVCNKGFVDSSALKKHQKTHSAANLAK